MNADAAANELKAKMESSQETKPLVCRCGASARFMPLYRFSSTSPAVLLQHPHTIKCGNCGQWYQYVDGWFKTGLLEDLELING